MPTPPPLRTGRAPFRRIRLKHEPTHLSQHAVNPIGLGITCTVREPSRLPTCLGGGSRTSKGPYGPADSSALLPNAGWRSSPVRPHQREVCSLSGGVMSQPLSGRLPAGLRFLPPPSPAALSARLTARFPVREDDGLTTFRRWNRPGGLGRVSSPVVRHLRRRSSEPPNLTTCLLAQACQPLWLVLCDDVSRRFTWVDHATLSWAPTALRLAVVVSARASTTTPEGVRIRCLGSFAPRRCQRRTSR